MIATAGAATLGFAPLRALGGTITDLPLPGGPDERPITTAFPEKRRVAMEESMKSGKYFVRRRDVFVDDARAKGRCRAGVMAVALVAGFLAAASAHDAPHHGASSGLALSAPPAKPCGEAEYLAENDAAMSKMMNDMAVRPTGDVDRDFVAMMVPHHQGAIDMAVAVLRYGSNEKIRRLAQEIIVTQQDEIAAMRLALGEPLPPAIPSPTQVAPLNATEPHSRCDHSMNMHQEH